MLSVYMLMIAPFIRLGACVYANSRPVTLTRVSATAMITYWIDCQAMCG